MPTRLRAVVRCVLLAGVIAPPLALVALAADAPSDAKKTAPDVQPAKHRVCGTFLIHATEPAIWPAENKLDLAQFEFYKRNVAAIVKSSVVIDKALEDKGIQASPLIKQHGDKAADWLADQIAVEFPGNGEIMTVCMVAENDSQVRETRDMLNAVMEGFMKAFVYKERNDKLGRYDDLDRKFRAYKQEVLDKQRQLFDLVQAVGDKGAVALPQWKIAELKQLALEARRAEIQAELQIARTRHKLEGLADSSSEFKTVKADAELAEVDRKFWNDKSVALTKELGKPDERRVSSDKINAEADQLRAEIEQLQAVTREMGNTLERWKIELDVAPRILVLEPAH